MNILKIKDILLTHLVNLNTTQSSQTVHEHLHTTHTAITCRTSIWWGSYFVYRNSNMHSMKRETFTEIQITNLYTINCRIYEYLHVCVGVVCKSRMGITEITVCIINLQWFEKCWNTTEFFNLLKFYGILVIPTTILNLECSCTVCDDWVALRLQVSVYMHVFE